MVAVINVILDLTQMELAKRRVDNIKESIELAKSAVSLDVKDSRSWYYVGNAYLTQFFDVSKSIEDLERALRAYVFYTHNIAQIIHLD